MNKEVESFGGYSRLNPRDRFEIAFWTLLVVFVAIAIYYWQPTSWVEIVAAFVGFIIVAMVASFLLQRTRQKDGPDEDLVE